MAVLKIKHALAVLAIIAAGCGETTDIRERADEQPESGGSAVVGVASGATTILPALAAAALDFELGGNLFLPLNSASWKDGGLRYEAPHPLALAKGWTFGHDSSSLTYTLDTSHRWSDGQPVRAQDVVFKNTLSG
jgi:ABC-type transport system substrate-binding protein